MTRNWYVSPRPRPPRLLHPRSMERGVVGGPEHGPRRLQGRHGGSPRPLPHREGGGRGGSEVAGGRGQALGHLALPHRGRLGSGHPLQQVRPSPLHGEHVGRLDAHAAFDAALAVMEDPTPVTPIVRRPMPPWRPEDSSMLYIPLSPIRGSRFDLIERAQVLTREECAVTGHSFRLGGVCITCDARCPHPEFADEGHIRPTCTTCGCLEPIPDTRDHYEVPFGGVQDCLLGTYPEEE